MENRVWRSVRTKCLEQRAKQEMRLVETPLRQKQLSKGRKTWKCAGSRGDGEHTLGQEGGHRPRGGKTKTGEGADSQGREIAS